MSSLAPANLSILKPDQQMLSRLRPVKVLDVFEGGTTNFHDEGLFSVTTFGRVGLPERDINFSYIDIRVAIIHPYLFRTLVSLRRFYQDVMQGREYAVWDDKEQDLVRSDILNGDTGYQFFMEHLPIIKFKQSESEERRRKIMLIEKAIKENKMTTTKILVIPAGLRDAEIDKEGRVVQSEINDFYRTLLGISNAVVGSNDLTNRVFDVSRNSMQRTFNELFDYIFSMLEGKRGLIASKWAARNVMNGTRNVITSLVTPVKKLGDPSSVSIKHTVVGLYQTMKGVLPLAIHLLLSGWLSHVFAEGQNARLVNRTTLKSEVVHVDHDTVDEWTTESGISKLIDAYGDTSIRLKPVMINDYYIGLVYRGPNKTFRIFGDIDELPVDRGFSREDVHPLTLTELMYLSCYERFNKVGIITTRFPYSGIRSTYPTLVRVMTTERCETRYELNDDWTYDSVGRMDDLAGIATAYPTFKDNAHFDTMAPHFAFLAGLGADFDGDKCSGNMIYSQEATQEIHDKLNDPANYLDVDGKLLNSSMIDPVVRVLYNMSGRAQ